MALAGPLGTDGNHFGAEDLASPSFPAYLWSPASSGHWTIAGQVSSVTLRAVESPFGERLSHFAEDITYPCACSVSQLAVCWQALFTGKTIPRWDYRSRQRIDTSWSPRGGGREDFLQRAGAGPAAVGSCHSTLLLLWYKSRGRATVSKKE